MAGRKEENNMRSTKNEAARQLLMEALCELNNIELGISYLKVEDYLHGAITALDDDEIGKALYNVERGIAAHHKCLSTKLMERASNLLSR